MAVFIVEMLNLPALSFAIYYIGMRETSFIERRV